MENEDDNVLITSPTENSQDEIVETLTDASINDDDSILISTRKKAIMWSIGVFFIVLVSLCAVVSYHEMDQNTSLKHTAEGSSPDPLKNSVIVKPDMYPSNLFRFILSKVRGNKRIWLLAIVTLLVISAAILATVYIFFGRSEEIPQKDEPLQNPDPIGRRNPRYPRRPNINRPEERPILAIIIFAAVIASVLTFGIVALYCKDKLATLMKGPSGGGQGTAPNA